MPAYDSILTSVVDPLEKMVHSKTVFGEALTVGNLTLIPVLDVMFGYGAGGGEGNTSGNSGTGGGGGGGARISARAIIVIKGDDVSVMPLTKGGALEKILDAVPGLIEKAQASKAG